MPSSGTFQRHFWLARCLKVKLALHIVMARARGSGDPAAPARPREEEETVKRFVGWMMATCLLLALAAPATAAPAATAEPQDWTWTHVLDTLLGWTDGIWRTLAGSETGGTAGDEPVPPPPVPEGGQTLMMVESGPGEECESTPEYDPDGHP